MAVRDLISVTIYLAIILALIGHEGIDAIVNASMISSGIRAIFFPPITGVH